MTQQELWHGPAVAPPTSYKALFGELLVVFLSLVPQKGLGEGGALHDMLKSGSIENYRHSESQHANPFDSLACQWTLCNAVMGHITEKLELALVFGANLSWWKYLNVYIDRTFGCFRLTARVSQVLWFLWMLFFFCVFFPLIVCYHLP